MKFWTRSIRVRLAGTITATVALVLGLVAVLTYVLVRNTLYANVDSQLATHEQLLASVLEKKSNATLAGNRFVQNEFDPEHPANVQILTRDGTAMLLAPGGTTRLLPTSIQPIYGTLYPEQLHWFATATELYYITLAVPVGDIEESLRVLRLTLGIAIPAALFAALFLGYRIARNSLAPIDEISATAHRITSQSLRKRIPETGVDDELGRLVNTLNEMIARLEGSFTAITTFTTNAAHEMRTPLTILRGEMELALRNKNIGAEERALVESNVEEVNRLISIVEDLFTLARADANAFSLANEIVPLNDLLNRILSKIESLAATKNIHVELINAPGCVIIGDANRLTQVIINLVDNAVKYSPAHSSVQIELKKENAMAVIRVTDAGQGIDAAHHEKIFERFYRADDARTRSIGGTGLGLAIVQSIVAAHNGTIRVESAPGRGSTFIVAIPLAEID